MKRRVGQFLIDEIAKYNVDKIFGVPGDFNLAFLDDIIAHDQLEWVGNTNELNASYAADGYARIKGLSALVTTFGVGELSAINGIAGSYAENVPVIAITGAPTIQAEKSGRYIHHSLGTGTFDDYRKMFEPITTTQAYITTDNALEEIPRVIQAAYDEKRPVHIHLPIDVAMKEIDVPERVEYPEKTSFDLTATMSKVEKALKNAQQPTLIVGHQINSYHLHDEVQALAEKMNLPVAQLSFGKTAFKESSSQYMGIYDGSIAAPRIRDYVDQSDLIILLGAKLTDSATAGFSQGFDEESIITLNYKDIKIQNEVIQQPSLPDIVSAFKDIDYQFEGHYPKYEWPRENQYSLNDAPLTQKNYFDIMQSFIRSNDVILADQGTSFFGGYDLALPDGATFIGQPLWGSIGYTLPATLGAQLADRSRRHILLIGDGSLQLTVQEISTMIRQKLHPIIFVINNDGYTVERKIHGETEPYNDIQMWDYKALPALFGGRNVPTHDVKTSQELYDTLKQIENNPNQMHFVEVHMDVHDAPEKLEKISKVFAEQNK
ncbi:alpha-keto acid decarboxylase family protein [Staphylococcus felis]|uniref:alpha-keto acid decarboxylase family protein n=1 Tax=Staphylococcus felis TaxID=46127 RepID=UPI000E287324|nr:alpha-keto acid decarboxylase family protein [Staphylococcus felis]REI22272.1 alpha-keto acid decarboxylase family protein [Staphylococcus felis]